MRKKINESMLKMVSILNEGKYHDGNSLGHALNMTRSAVWKMIKKLQHYGVPIQALKGKGYVLLEPLILLNPKKIKLPHAHKKINLYVFESLTSTNDYLKVLKKNGTINICLAEQQTQGRGRFNRTWHSPFGKNIYLSCLYPFQKDVSELAGLSLVVSLAIAKTLKSYAMDDHLAVKWPNDIVYRHQKLSGSLIEIQAETHGTSEVTIGIGLNVNLLPAESQPIAQAWTSMKKIIGQDIDRNIVCTRLINQVIDYLQQFETKGFSPFMKEWIALDSLHHQTIALKNVNHTVTGTVTGINEQGHLLLKLPNGQIQAFSSGDTTVVKVQ